MDREDDAPRVEDAICEGHGVADGWSAIDRCGATDGVLSPARPWLLRKGEGAHQTARLSSSMAKPGIVRLPFSTSVLAMLRKNASHAGRLVAQ